MQKPLRPWQYGLLLLILPGLCLAEWAVSLHAGIGADSDTGAEIRIAHIKNAAGYRLEIYKDDVAAIRSRFSLDAGLDRLAARSCPTYQVDSGQPDNRSVNGATCLNQAVWSEYILGYVSADKRVASKHLYALLYGRGVTFRYRLENGSYHETRFSLTGSKRATLAALGEDLIISP